MRPTKNLENNIPSDTYGRVQLECMKVQAYSSSKTPLDYIQDQTLLTNQGWLWTSCQLGSYMNTIQIEVSSRVKAGEEITEMPRLKFLEKF